MKHDIDHGHRTSSRLQSSRARETRWSRPATVSRRIVAVALVGALAALLGQSGSAADPPGAGAVVGVTVDMSAAEPGGPVSGEAAPAPVVGQELLEAHPPGGAVVYLDDEGLLVVPTGVVDPDEVRSAVCADGVPDRPRFTVDSGPGSVATVSTLDSVIGVLGCDVTGFAAVIDGETATLVVGAGSIEAEDRLRTAAGRLPPGVIVDVVLDVDERG